MSQKTDPGEVSQLALAIGRARGLERACDLNPAAIVAAAARGSRPLSALSTEFPPTAEPACGFDPAAFAADQ